MICWNCGNSFDGEVFRTTECPSCKKDLHSCRNCRFYSPGAHFDCSETVEYNVTDKEKSNFCDFFKSSVSNGNHLMNTETKYDAKKAVDALFGDSSEPEKKTGKDAFDALFG